MTDTLASAADLNDEVTTMAPGRLLEAERVGAWPVHPLRAGLDTPERLLAARAMIADLRRAHADEVWRQLGSHSGDTARPLITARQTGALAQAWARLGGDGRQLFHLRRVAPPVEELRVSWARRTAPRIGIDPNLDVPVAPYLEHPISLAEAARFAILLPVLDRCAALGEAATRALDAIGQPTHALHAWAGALRESPLRRPVWRLRSAVRGDHARLRMATLTVIKVLADLDDRALPGCYGLPGLLRHPSGWSTLETLTLGTLAWRLARGRDLRIQRAASQWYHSVNLRPAVIGRRYAELDDPFAPLLATLRLGCRLHAYAPATMTFELWH